MQDMSQTKALYKERCKTFLGNSGLMQLFANNDLRPSKKLGKSTIMQMSKGEIRKSRRPRFHW
jgi:hypothetical protein